MAITVSVSYQYYLKENFDSILDIFYSWGDSEYKEAFKLMARSVLRTVCAKYDAFTFIYDKQGKKTEKKSFSSKFISK